MKCEHCGYDLGVKEYHLKILGKKNDTVYLCPKCYAYLSGTNTEKFYCNRCKTIHFRTGLNGVKIKNNYYCDGCFPSSFPVKRYSFKPMPVFYRTDFANSNNDYIGFELEIEFFKDPLKELRKKTNAFKYYSIVAAKALGIRRKLRALGLGGFIYLKMDSTIGGFELVSHPFTYNWFKKQRGSIEKLFKYLLRVGAVSYKYGNAGIHFHMNRDNLTAHEIRKLVLFCSYNYQKIIKIAQRGATHYCTFKESHSIKVFLREYSYKIAEYNLWEHYYAINRTNKSTVELRFFRGTLNFTVFRGLVEFIFSLKSFIRGNSIMKLHKGSWNLFIRYCYDSGFKLFINLWNKLGKSVLPITDRDKI